MSSAKPRLAVIRGGQSAAPAARRSLPNMLDQARFAHPRVVARMLPVAEVTRDEAIERWIALLTRHCGTREACAAMFGVTFQTACNWFDGVSAPSAAAVFQAVDWWGDDLCAPAVRRAA